MEISLSDLVDSCNGDLFLDLELSEEHGKSELRFLKELRRFFRKHNKPTSQIDSLIHRIEGNLDLDNVIKIFDIDEDSIKSKIEKHPYFKNPCNYPIRLITIMKYLKKKGVDISYKDIDLVVDRLIQEMDGVKKVGNGMYLKKQY